MPGPRRRDLIQQLGVCLSCAAGLPGRASARPRRPPDVLRVSLAAIDPGQEIRVTWARLPIFIRRRTLAEIAVARATRLADLRDPQSDEQRVIDPEWLVVVGKCTHAGCTPVGGLGRYGGWLCFCHGSQFDTSGRVRRGPARTNLAIPPYRFSGPGRLEIGVGDGPAPAAQEPAPPPEDPIREAS